MAPEKFKPINWADPFFKKVDAQNEKTLFLKYSTWVVNKRKMYYEDEITPVVQQCKWHVAYFLRMLSLETGKYAPGDVKAMCTYLKGELDITGTKERGGLYNRKLQVANWLWPVLVPDYEALRSEGAANKKVYTMAHKHMTAVRAFAAMHEWFVDQNGEMPTKWKAGVDPVPAPKPKRQGKKRAAGEDGEGEDGEDGEEELEEPGAVRLPEELSKPQVQVLVAARAAAREAEAVRAAAREAAAAKKQRAAPAPPPTAPETDTPLTHIEGAASRAAALFGAAGLGGGD